MIISSLFIEKQNLKFALINYRAVPDVKLTNTLSYSSYDNSFSGSATGFVKFEEGEKQPKNLDLRQYYSIQPTNQRDAGGNQVLTLDEIIVMSQLPPESIGKSKMTKKNEIGSVIVLEDENGVRFYFNKDSKEISMKNEDSSLVTNDLEYRDFVRKFLR